MIKGRIIEEHKTNYRIAIGETVFTGTVRGSFFDDQQFPKVGDYVMCESLDEEKVIIDEILPRSSVISRKAAETEDEQVIVTNVDIIFVVMGLDGDFNLNRLNRYLELAAQSKVDAVVILNKTDQAENLEEMRQQVLEIAGDKPVHCISALKQENMDVFSQYITPATTAVLLGSSGAGKSTITNYLLGTDKMKTQEVREDDSRGKHTTTSRQMHVLPGGGFLIDTPGMRELGVIENHTEIIDESFDKVDGLMAQCQFNNCDHEKSKGCAVLPALEAGVITDKDLLDYYKVLGEKAYAESKKDTEAAWQYKHEQKKLYQKHEKIRKRKYSNQDPEL